MVRRLSPIAVLILLGACSYDLELDRLQEDLSLVQCRADADCGRGMTCVAVGEIGVCSTGDRCDSSRDCPFDAVCRGEPGRCFLVERDPGDAGQCPRGSVEGRVSCPTGFESHVVSRDPHCETCELDPRYAERCRNAGFTQEECRRLLLGLSDDEGAEIDETQRRCRLAGYTPRECRRLLNDPPDDWDAIFRRCRAAGYSAEECRELFVEPADVADPGDYDDLIRRCRAAGYDEAECRRLLSQ